MKVTPNYLNRDFYSLKEDLQSYLKLYYPNEYNDFSESSLGSLLVDLNAYVGDILSHHVDKNFNELFLESAVNRTSVIKLADNLGYKPRGRLPSITILNISISVPPNGDSHDERFLLTLQKGFRATNQNGKDFEVLEEVNFSNHTSLTGMVDRTIEPVYNSKNEIIEYTITKSVPAVAGSTKTGYLEVTSEKAIPFMRWYVDNTDTEITEVLDVISKDTRFTPTTEEEWYDNHPDSTGWYEVDSLPQERVFVDTSLTGDSSEGYWKYIDARYITQFDENGNISLTFGAGVKDYDTYQEYIANGLANISKVSLLNNDSLGTIPEIGKYLHIRYRSGGGPLTNCGQGTITKISEKVVSYIPGTGIVPPNDIADVINSISVTNPIPAIGGKDFETLDEMKVNAKYNFSSQDRCVTIDDYISRVGMMPAKYGGVFRSYAKPDETTMNTAIYVLTRDELGKLKNTGNEQIKYNVASYLSNYKMLNDFVQIMDGRIINLSMNFVVQVLPDYNKKTVIIECINALKNYFKIEGWQMNSTIYISQINELLRKQPGVTNVVSIQFFNKVGGDYSNDVLAMGGITPTIVEGVDAEVVPINNTIKAPITGMVEFKYPERDILGGAIS